MSYPTPEELVTRVQEMINPDGYVTMYDEDEDEHFTVGPYPVVDLEDLPQARRERRLYELATSIHGAIVNVGLFDSTIDRQAEIIAPHLARYRDRPDFIELACSYIKKGEYGVPMVKVPDNNQRE